MQYLIIKDDRHYVKQDYSGKFSLVTNLQLAARFDQEKANSYIVNNVPKKERHRYRVIEDEETIVTSKLCAKPVTSPLIFDDENIEWVNVCNQFELIVSQLPQYKNILLDKLKLIEAAKTDIDHRFELPKSNGKELNAVELVKLAKLKRDFQRKRRKIKDSLKYIEIIETSSLDDFSNGRVSRRLEGMQHREYAPRVLNNLFDDDKEMVF